MGKINMKLKLTSADIQTDIAGLVTRIESARSKLEALPGGYLPYSEFKKTLSIRRELELEVLHVEKLILIAREALEC